MLGLNELIPEIMIGIGAAVFIGSGLALLRGSAGGPARGGLNPSDRPRAVRAGGQVTGASGDDDAAGSTGAADTAGAKGTELDAPAGESVAEGEGGPSDVEERQGPYVARTVFFMLAGAIAMIWGIASLLAR